MADAFSGYTPSLTSPYADGAAVTPHDTNELSTYSRALYVGTGGDLVVTLRSGNDVTLTGVVSGSLLRLWCTKVKSTGTTASDIVALW